MSVSEKIPLSQSDLKNRTKDQIKIIEDILKQNNPIECQILGKKTVNQISKGNIFDDVEGGRHVNFIETISLLSGIATLTQCAILLFSHLKSKSKVKHHLEEAITKGDDLQELRMLITKDGEIISKTVDKVTKYIDN